MKRAAAPTPSGASEEIVDIDTTGTRSVVSPSAAVDDSDDSQPLTVQRPQSRPAATQQCPYMDTIDRSVLDFDMEKVCSVTLRAENVYACLVCGRYFQGRSAHSPAFQHALQAEHYLFINLQSTRVFCLPDGYEVVHPSLHDIQRVLRPRFDEDSFRRDGLLTSSSSSSSSRSNRGGSSGNSGSGFEPGAVLDGMGEAIVGLDGAARLLGTTGLTAMDGTDSMCAVLQMLLHCRPLRDYFLLPERNLPRRCRSRLVATFGELVRKMWNRHNFRGVVSPHELLHIVVTRSSGRFRLGKQAEPIDFLSWLLNALHKDLVEAEMESRGGGEAGGASKETGVTSIVERTFGGRVRVTTEYAGVVKRSSGGEGAAVAAAAAAAGAGAGAGAGSTVQSKVITAPFMFLTVDLPDAPLFNDRNKDDNIVPEAQLEACLGKYSGDTETRLASGEVKRYEIVKLPPNLLLMVKRFTVNSQFQREKNPTLINFPMRDLDMGAFVTTTGGGGSSSSSGKTKPQILYRLDATVAHDGDAKIGTYSAFVHQRAANTWFKLQQALCDEVIDAQVCLADTVLQAWSVERVV